MSDQNVKAAQKYLNAMFGGHKDWVKLDEDGKTGTAVMQGIIRAFQIQNGISTITGTVGPLTINTMKKLAIITKMDPNDTPQVNVCLIQCALFCKGYAAGGITGIYYTSGVNAVKKMQENAGLEVTGKIDWKVWSGLLSLNWFTKVSGGDSNIVLIQQQLNSDWSDVIGVGPCDGIASRQTILSLVGALQAAEGVTTELITDLNSVNFGDATTNAFPGTLQNGQNSTKYVPFNKIAQYGLYFNGYNPGRFDGVFDSTTESKVSEFQEFYGLTGIGLVTKGKVNVSTMKSLLTSKGDTNRAAKACDCATVLNKQQALDIKNAGYTHVGRYLTGSVGKEHTPKYLTSTEVKNIENAGLSVFPIYQDGGYELNYFKDPSQGSVDAQTAILAAERIGIPSGTTIYFAVDFDCYSYQIDTFIIPYFEQIHMIFFSSTNDKNYKVGIYAPRYVCTKVYEAGLASKSFVADMSTGFSCNLGYSMPKNWAFDQFCELNSFSSSPSFPLDKDAYSGRDTGFKKFDAVSTKTDEEIAQENLRAKVKIARNQYVYNVMEPLGYLNKIMDVGVEYDKEISLGTMMSPQGAIDISTKISTSLESSTGKIYNIKVDIGNDGELTQTCKNQIMEISSNLSDTGIEGADNFGNTIEKIALSVKSGNIAFEINNVFANSVEFSIVFSTSDLLPEEEKEWTISVALIFTMTLNSNSGLEFNVVEFTKEHSNILAGAVILVLAGALVVNAIPSIIALFSAGAGTVFGLLIQAGRMFKIYMYTAIAPIPISSFAGEPTQSIGKNFIRSYIGVCLEGAIIALACIIFSAYAASPPAVGDTELSAVTIVWNYVGELVFNLLVLVGAIKASDRIVREMMGLGG